MSDILSSDVLESQFGPTEVEILMQDKNVRVICTKAKDGGRVLELSKVSFDKAGVMAFAEVHRDIASGKSMGKAFRDRGIAFKRRVHAVCVAGQGQLPDNLSMRFGRPGLATIVDTSILVGPGDMPYADILEVYGPDVSWPSEGSAMRSEMAERLERFDRLLKGLGT